MNSAFSDESATGFLRLLGVILVCCALLIADKVAADDSITVYRWQRPDGTVEFSDEQRSGAEPVVVEEPMIQPSRGLNLPSRPQTVAEFSYESLVITGPVSDATFRNSEADEVAVIGEIEPGLRGGHRVFLLVDGVVEGQGRSPSFKTGRLERGTHLLQLEIRSSDGETIMHSDRVRINVHRNVARQPAGGAS